MPVSWLADALPPKWPRPRERGRGAPASIFDRSEGAAHARELSPRQAVGCPAGRLAKGRLVPNQKGTDVEPLPWRGVWVNADVAQTATERPRMPSTSLFPSPPKRSAQRPKRQRARLKVQRAFPENWDFPARPTRLSRRHRKSVN